MFNEVLQINVVLSNGSVQKMERQLNTRFNNVGRRFGVGLKNIIKGTFFGVSAGLLANLLNPIQKLQDKIEALLGQGQDITDLADKFGTDPGKLSQVQNIARVLGVKPDEFRELLTKFQDAIQNARDNIEENALDPKTGITGTTRLLSPFLQQKDVLDAFTSFLAVSAGKGGTGILDPEIAARLSGAGGQAAAQRAVFGHSFTGAEKRFANADFSQELARIGGPSSDSMAGGLKRLAALAEQQRLLQVRNESGDLVNASNTITPSMIQEIEAFKKTKSDRETRELQSFDDLKKAQMGIDSMVAHLQEINKSILKIVAAVNDFFVRNKDNAIIKFLTKGRWL